MLPNVHYFHPTCEMAIANGGVSYTPPATIGRFEHDLATLPIVFAGATDHLLVPYDIPQSFTEHLSRAGFQLPRFVGWAKAVLPPYLEEPKGYLMPWGWSPTAHNKFKKFKDNCSDAFKASPVAFWTENSKGLYSRATALKVLKLFLDRVAEREPYISAAQLPVVCHTMDELVRFLDERKKLMLKAPWSSSGKGLLELESHFFPKNKQQWVLGFLKQQGYLMAEPFLDQVINFALHFKVVPGQEVQYVGMSTFSTTNNNKYQGNNLNRLLRGLSAAEKVFFTEELIAKTALILAESVRESDIYTQYEGYIGIDGLLFKDEEGQLRIQPCLEINMRHNMGVLALKIQEHLAPGSYGDFCIAAQKPYDLLALQSTLEREHPLVMDGAFICQGYLPLSPLMKDSSYLAYIIVKPAH